MRAERRREVTLDPPFIEDMRYWAVTHQRTLVRLLDLVDAVQRDPFGGIGKPEPLKHMGPDTWSRRLTDEHRVVYRVERDRLVFLQARYHYGR